MSTWASAAWLLGRSPLLRCCRHPARGPRVTGLSSTRSAARAHCRRPAPALRRRRRCSRGRKVATCSPSGGRRPQGRRSSGASPLLAWRVTSTKEAATLLRTTGHCRRRRRAASQSRTWWSAGPIGVGATRMAVGAAWAQFWRSTGGHRPFRYPGIRLAGPAVTTVVATAWSWSLPLRALPLMVLEVLARPMGSRAPRQWRLVWRLRCPAPTPRTFLLTRRRHSLS
mmetsp:Transcript_54699/g.151743  ORF Transcript_54699/g.151743 Transcript_54699/m.151743 type:complete len:226 (-) Transcript_54699:923-1600(-)